MEQKAAAKRERERLADEASNAQFKRLRHDFQAHLNKGRRGAEQTSPAVAMAQTDKTERADTRGAETAAPGEVHARQNSQKTAQDKKISTTSTRTSSSLNWASHG